MRSTARLTRGFFAAVFSLWTFGAVAADDAPRTLRLGYILPESHAQALGAHKLADLIASKTGSRIKVQTFGNGVLGDELKMAAQVQGGLLDLLIITTSPLVGTVKELGVLDALFLYRSPEEIDAVLEGPIGDRLLAKATEKGMVGLSWMEAGFRSMTNSKRAIRTAKDVEGLKFRTMQNKIFIDSFSALGANPVPLPFTEAFTAMETKAVDGAEIAPGGIETNQWYEVQKYVALTRHAFAAHMVVASKKLWDSLSDGDKKMLKEAALEASTFERGASRKQEEDALAFVKSKGMTVTELSSEEQAKLEAKVQPVIDAIGKSAGEDLMKEVKETVARVRKK